MPKPKGRTPAPMETPGFGLRVGISIIVIFGWIIFTIVWLLFFAGGFSTYQNLAAILVSILAGFAVLAASWASWGVKYGWKYGKEWKKMEDKSGHSRRPDSKCCKFGFRGGSAIYGLGFIGALVYYVSTAPTFWDAVIGFFKAIFWPAFLVFGALKAMGL